MGRACKVGGASHSCVNDPAVRAGGCLPSRRELRTAASGPAYMSKQINRANTATHLVFTMRSLLQSYNGTFLI